MKCRSPIWNLLFDDTDLSIWALYFCLYVKDYNNVKKYTKTTHQIMHRKRKVVIHKRNTDGMYDLFYIN